MLAASSVPGTVQRVMDELATRTGRAYRLVEYAGVPDAEHVVVVMGSGAGGGCGDRRRAEQPG
jgi:pyruvate-ferredoxin/flavodoxin oxidoreductase